jgi:hypothetical protein
MLDALGMQVFNHKEKYHCIQSSAQGVIYVQDGMVFNINGALIGLAPEWGPDLFAGKDGSAKDPFTEVMNFARANKVKEKKEKAPEKDVDSLLDDEAPLTMAAVSQGRKGKKVGRRAKMT